VFKERPLRRWRTQPGQTIGTSEDPSMRTRDLPEFCPDCGTRLTRKPRGQPRLACPNEKCPVISAPETFASNIIDSSVKG